MHYPSTVEISDAVGEAVADYVDTSRAAPSRSANESVFAHGAVGKGADRR
jgi:hypothetical protein